MSAKELFKKLKCNYFENEERITIEFYNSNIDDYDYIEFDKLCRELSISIDNYNLLLHKFNFKEFFNAINKQIEELGW